jgi:hypothetical protein
MLGISNKIDNFANYMYYNQLKILVVVFCETDPWTYKRRTPWHTRGGPLGVQEADPWAYKRRTPGSTRGGLLDIQKADSHDRDPGQKRCLISVFLLAV